MGAGSSPVAMTFAITCSMHSRGYVRHPYYFQSLEVMLFVESRRSSNARLPCSRIDETPQERFQFISKRAPSLRGSPQPALTSYWSGSKYLSRFGTEKQRELSRNF